MLEQYLVTDIRYYSDDKSYFLWAFFETKITKAYSGCPLCRPSTPSMFSDFHPLTEVFNPTTFMDVCKQEWETPRVILIPKNMPYEITNDRWQVVTEDTLDIQSILEAAIAKGKTHVLATFKNQNPEFWLSPPKDLEETRKKLIENKMFDDYFYDFKCDGGNWCLGISMKEDEEACDTYQKTHPDKCKGCKRYWMDQNPTLSH